MHCFHIMDPDSPVNQNQRPVHVSSSWQVAVVVIGEVNHKFRLVVRFWFTEKSRNINANRSIYLQEVQREGPRDAELY